MNVRIKTSRVRVIAIDAVNRKVTLDTVFNATLDKGVHRFEKHFTKLYNVDDSDLIERLEKDTGIDSIIEVNVANDYGTFEMFLQDFKVL